MTTFSALQATGGSDYTSLKCNFRGLNETKICIFYRQVQFQNSDTQACNRIGSYYSPSAITLTKDVLKEKIKGSSFSSPAPPKQSQTMISRQNSRLSSYSEMPEANFYSVEEVRHIKLKTREKGDVA